MPIGKNSIKRVKDGYSNVSTAAPDMENSTVIANPAPEVIELATKKAEPETPKKCGRKSGSKNAQKTAPKSDESKAPAKKAKMTPKQKTDTAQNEKPDGFLRYSLGDEMPVHLL